MDVVVMITEFKNQLKARGYAASTITCYSQYLSYFRDYLVDLAITDIKKINHQTIRDYQAMVMDKDLAMETQGLRIRPVKRFFSYLLETHRLLIDPTEGIVEVTRKGRKMPPVLTIDEMKKLLEQPNLSLRMQIRDRVIMEVLYTTAIRLDELLALEIYDVDFKDKVIFIRKGKGRRQRVVPLGENAIRFLKEYLEKIRPRYAKKNAKERKLFLTNEGKPISPGTIRAFLRTYRIAAKISKTVSPHTFRRTCATHMLQQGADIRYIQKLLGHKNLRTTQIYTKVAPVDIKKTHDQTHPGIKGKIK
jgi:integrase/recombinase XerD